MKRAVAILAGIVVLSCLAVPARADKWIEVDARQLKAMMDAGDVVVVNVLSSIEFNDLAIKGSINIPLGELAQKMPKEKDKKIVFYCLGMKWIAAPEAASWAADHGYTKVYAFRGGLPEWIQAGYETVSIEKLPKVEIPKIRPADLKDLLDSGTPLVLLDIRPAMESSKVWIDSGNRIGIPFEELNTRMAEIPKRKRIVIVDFNGKRAPVAGQYLTLKGYDNLSNLDGGMYAWIATEKPVKRGQ